MTNYDKAMKAFNEGSSCSQAVFAPFAEKLGLDIETANKLSSGFGGGMQIEGPCGVISAAYMALGLKYGPDKKDVYPKTSEFIKRFKERNPSIKCVDLLKLDYKADKTETTKQCSRKNICCKLVKDACEILEEMDF